MKGNATKTKDQERLEYVEKIDPAAMVGCQMLLPLLQVAEGLGCSRYDLLMRAGIEPGCLSYADAHIPLRSYLLLVNIVEHRTQNKNLGIFAGRVMHWTNSHVFRYLFDVSDTLRESLKRFPPDLAATLANIGKVQTRKDRQRVRFEWLPLVLEKREQRFLSDFILSCLALNIGTFCFRPVPVVRVDFSYPKPADTTLLAAAFGCSDLRFDCPVSSVYISAEALDYKVIHAADDLSDEVSDAVSEMLCEAEEGSAFLRSLRGCIAGALPSGKVTAEKVASNLNCSVRSLQRQISKSGSSFSEVLQTVRKSMAVHYLQSKNMSVTETALLLGYSTPEAFARAFKSWYGVSPKKYGKT